MFLLQALMMGIARRIASRYLVGGGLYNYILRAGIDMTTGSELCARRIRS